MLWWELSIVNHMIEQKDQITLIEKYLHGHLDPEERISFEKQLNSDPELAKKTSSYRDSYNVEVSQHRYKFKRGLLAVGRKGKNLSQNIADLHKKKTVVKILGIFIVLIICLVSTYFIVDKSSDNIALFNQYYNESLAAHPLLRDIDLEQEETNGIAHYQNRDLSRAIPALEKEIIVSPGDARLYLYLGLTYLESNLDEKALVNFKMAESLSEDKIRDSAIWYMALTELKLNHTKEAKQTLVQLIKNTGTSSYTSKARVLLRQL